MLDACVCVCVRLKDEWRTLEWWAKVQASSCPLLPPSQGVTFRVEKDDLVIARILHGGMIDRQGLLHVGDIIKEVNGKDVGNNPTELQDTLKDCSGGITLKILPSYRDAPAPPQVNARSRSQAGPNPAPGNGLPTIPCAGM